MATSDPRSAPANGVIAPDWFHPAMNPTNCTTMISGPGVVLGQPRWSIICGPSEPAVLHDPGLADVGQHGIGPAEVRKAALGEEERLREENRGAGEQPQPDERDQPQDRENGQEQDAAPRRRVDVTDFRGRRHPIGRLVAVLGLLRADDVELPGTKKPPASGPARPRSRSAENGTLRKKMETKEAAAMAIMTVFLSDFRPMRITAAKTIAVG